jgi:hypothetical protein
MSKRKPKPSSSLNSLALAAVVACEEGDTHNVSRRARAELMCAHAHRKMERWASLTACDNVLVFRV